LYTAYSRTTDHIVTILVFADVSRTEYLADTTLRNRQHQIAQTFRLTSCVHVCNELIKSAEQRAGKAHDYKPPEFFGAIKLDTVKYGFGSGGRLNKVLNGNNSL
jgi:hypothetical protein